MTCGIYILKFELSDKVYVGQSTNIENRLRKHSYILRNGKGSNKLQYAYNKYGTMYSEVLLECEESELTTNEAEAISIFNSIDNGLNSREASLAGPNYGIQGDKNYKAIYPNELVEQAFLLIEENNLKLVDIAKTLGMSTQAVSHIALGNTHKWLKEKYGSRYNKVLEVDRTIKEFTPIDITNGVDTITIRSYQEIMDLLDIKYSTATSFLNGTNKVLLEQWKLKSPKPKRVKKPTYAIKNNFSSVEETFTSVLEVLTKHSIPNRPKFTKWLRGEIDNSAPYNGWSLVSVSHNNLLTDSAADDI